jgi:phosphatidylinositol alpha-1,6-mannosyltransferase
VIGHAPTLAAISLESTGGGVAVVARLLWDVFAARWDGSARLLTLIERTHTQPSFAEKTRYALRLARVQATGETDFVLYSHLGLAKPLRAIPRAWQKPYGVFLHGIEAWCPLPPRLHDVLAHAAIRLANSPFTASRVMERHPDVGPVLPCPLALPANLIAHSASPSADAVPAIGPHAVLVVGRMLAAESYKGHDEMIDAWPAVVARVPDATLVFAGAGDDTERLREKAQASGVGRSIQFTGFVSRPVLDALYERAALFALPSRGEGFGLVYLEAMAHRRACIGSVHDAARDVIADGETGALVDQDDREALADAVASLLENDDRRRRMGEAGFARLQQHFTFDRFAARMGTLLNGAAA